MRRRWCTGMWRSRVRETKAGGHAVRAAQPRCMHAGGGDGDAEAEADRPGDARAGGGGGRGCLINGEMKSFDSRTFISVASNGAAPPPVTVEGGRATSAGGRAGAPPSAAEAAWRTAADR
jgi:hypothetical protein